MSTNTKPTRQVIFDKALSTGILFFGVIFLTYWFYPRYDLAMHPVYTQGEIVSLAPESVTFKFYVPTEDKTYFFRREIRINESEKLKKRADFPILYPLSRPDRAMLLAIENPLPVWFFIFLNLLVLLSFILSVGQLRELIRSEKATSS